MFQIARKAIELLYTGVCNVYEYQQTVDPINKRTTQSEVLKIADQPCRVSFSTVKNAEEIENIANKQQEIKLFIAPELTIKAGSKIHVTQNGVSTWYESSGEPAVHSNHQEIVLVLVDTKA